MFIKAPNLVALRGKCRFENCKNISKNVKIGPYCVIDSCVSIDEGNELVNHVHFTGNTINFS